VTAFSSRLEYAAPVGFDGELKMIHFDFGVIAFSRSAGLTL
jgi:hypothetical protein